MSIEDYKKVTGWAKKNALTPAQERLLTSMATLEARHDRSLGLQEIADDLGVAIRTVQFHVKSLMERQLVGREPGKTRKFLHVIQWPPGKAFDRKAAHRAWINAGDAGKRGLLSRLGATDARLPGGIVTAQDAYRDCIRIAREMGAIPVADAIASRSQITD